MNRDQLRAALTFYSDLGVTDLYRVAPGQAPVIAEVAAPIVAVKTQAPIPVPIPEMLIPLAPPDDTLEKIQADIGPDCRRCGLCEQRNKIVFGSGNANARLVFVGEGPGADEDAQGFPFVGRAGQ